jgi:hypothetical protein
LAAATARSLAAAFHAGLIDHAGSVAALGLDGERLAGRAVGGLELDVLDLASATSPPPTGR